MKSTTDPRSVSLSSTHLNDRGTCSVQSIQTVSVPRIVRSKCTFNAGSSTNLIKINQKNAKYMNKFFFKAWAPKYPVTHTQSKLLFWSKLIYSTELLL